MNRTAGAARVTVVGSLNMDLVARAPRLSHPGETLAGHTFSQVAAGKGGNQAVAAARLGADGNGAQLRSGLKAEGIDCSAVETGKAATGVALIVVDDGSQNAIVIIAGTNGELTPEMVARHEAVLVDADVVICQLETPPDTVRAALAAARRLGKIVILNPAPATRPLPADWLPLVDYLIPNELEAATLTGLQVETPEDAAKATAALQAVLYDAPKVNAVDTTAAGDTFIGVFAAQLAEGADIEAAIRFAQPSIPTRAELDAST
ncbi:MAG: Ribokinase (EC [uncultured Paraburkholderia sp.]|nr:MAG: Ribokinase (EC [uncultured Paraburkholderia sp.]CAH2939630.1 MAG: Ribokinase (EC [uncultured Paraburkholderia sp.]